MNYRGKLHVRILRYVLVALVLVVTLTPIYVVVSNSFRPTLEMKQMPPELIFEPTLVHLQRLIERDSFFKYFRNSVVISVSVTVLTVMLGSLSAYGLKLFQSRIGERLSNLLLVGKLVPSITILVPFYVMLNRIHLTGTYVGPILAHSAMTIPFVTWLMESFIRGLPNELLESAYSEGATRLTTFRKIVFPMLSPAIASAAVLVLRFSWNELIFSLQLTSLDTYPLTVGIARYVGAISVDWGKSSTAATMAMVPLIAVGFFMQRYLVTGLTVGAVKN